MSVIQPQPFCLTHTRVTALASGGTNTQQVNVSNDADFIVTEIRGMIIKAAKFTTGGVQVSIQLANGDFWNSGAFNMLSFSSWLDGTTAVAGIPIKLPGVMIPRNSQLEITFTNNDGAVIADIQLQLWGYKKK